MDPLFSWPALLSIAIGYLLGSIPFGLILTRLAGLGDVRRIGSGNIGATNVLRTGNKGLAALTLVLDALKGTAAVLFGHYFGAQHGVAIDAMLLAGLGAFLGHIFPVWLGFKGGKGVATYIGVIAGIYWPAAVIFCLVWIGTAVLTRYSSLSALVAAVVTPLFVLWTSGSWGGVPSSLAAEGTEMLDAWACGWLATIMTALLLWKHRANIGRLMRGEEPKIGAKA
jgi:glycerol-3-phosphate acyltransferase PlsY